MRATDELRRMLDERGVEWTKPKRIWWELIDSEPDDSVTIVEGVTIEAATDGTLVVYPLTPEQAIAATLGRGTCNDVALEGEWFECSACGCVRQLLHPHFCPSCGAEVVGPSRWATCECGEDVELFDGFHEAVCPSCGARVTGN